MTTEDKVGKTLGIVALVGLVLLVFQSYTSHQPITNDDIIRAGRERFQQQLPEGETVEVVSEQVLRPGHGGDEFGYWLKYRQKTAEGEWVDKEYYDE